MFRLYCNYFLHHLTSGYGSQKQLSDGSFFYLLEHVDTLLAHDAACSCYDLHHNRNKTNKNIKNFYIFLLYHYYLNKILYNFYIYYFI